MRVYLAGPMRGVRDFNFPAFKSGADRLRNLGHDVFSPAERDLAEVGDIFGSESGDLEEILARGFSLREALAADMVWIARHGEAVVLLPGWETSKGACAEAALGHALGIIVQPYDEFVAARVA
jgi:hypothetical protein